VAEVAGKLFGPPPATVLMMPCALEREPISQEHVNQKEIRRMTIPSLRVSR